MAETLRYVKGWEGKEYWFDAKGNVVKARIDGIDYCYDYDENGNKVYAKDSNGTEYWFAPKGNMIHKKYKDNMEFWYNNKGQIRHKKYQNGDEEWYGHDKNGKPILVRTYKNKKCSESDFALIGAVISDYYKTGTSDRKCPYCGTKIVKIDIGNSFSIRCQTPNCFYEECRGL